MTFSSGTSTTLTKSYWPMVAHCALTLAPSCSTSLLTSLMRLGLFLTVWTPSAESRASMMYVGMGEAVLDRLTGRRRARRHAAGPGAARPASCGVAPSSQPVAHRDRRFGALE